MKAAARWVAPLVACGLLACWPVAAEDVHKRFRLSLAIGGYQAQDEINSDSANVLTILNDEGEITARVIDPRNDASRNVLGKLGFDFWKQDLVEGFVDDLFRRRLP